MAEKYFDEETKQWVIRDRDGVRAATTYETSVGDDIEAGIKRYGKYVARFITGGLVVEKGIVDKLTEKYLTDEEKKELNEKIEKIESKPTYYEKAANLIGSEILQNMAVSTSISKVGDKQLMALGKHFIKKMSGKN
ncbi:hypothetical protein [Butyrivibrio sp. AC2005]|uniref:hypothetical protein n=1 Tax=Butyrivibrio sp. AC2005 TaxID=1280672 RepID=UPI000405E5C4|nr:hypothetical protein [Butyrivibrio sp. AC2005]